MSRHDTPASLASADLRASLGRAAVAVWAARLELALSAQFAREEEPVGYFAFVCRAAPRYLSYIETLRADHAQILLAVRELRRSASSRAGSTMDELEAMRDGLTSFIAEHEALEYEILEDALDC